MLFSLVNLLLDLYCCLQWFFFYSLRNVFTDFSHVLQQLRHFSCGFKARVSITGWVFAGGPPFLLTVLITSPSLKSPGGNLKPSPFCPGKLLDLHFFFFLSLKNIFPSWGVLEQERSSFFQSPSSLGCWVLCWGSGFLEAIPNVQAHLVIAVIHVCLGGFPGGSDGKESACNAVDMSSIPGSGRSPGKGNGSPLQYSWRIPWLEEPGEPQTMRSQRVTKHARTTIWPMTVFLGCCLFDVTRSLFLTFQYFSPHGTFINRQVPWNSQL